VWRGSEWRERRGRGVWRERREHIERGRERVIESDQKERARVRERESERQKGCGCFM
jgi:hypothetical protein